MSLLSLYSIWNTAGASQVGDSSLYSTNPTTLPRMATEVLPGAHKLRVNRVVSPIHQLLGPLRQLQTIIDHHCFYPGLVHSGVHAILGHTETSTISLSGLITLIDTNKTNTTTVYTGTTAPPATDTSYELINQKCMYWRVCGWKGFPCVTVPQLLHSMHVYLY